MELEINGCKSAHKSYGLDSTTLTALGAHTGVDILHGERSHQILVLLICVGLFALPFFLIIVGPTPRLAFFGADFDQAVGYHAQKKIV